MAEVPSLQPGHIGLLLRKLTQAQDYLDALRRYDIPYVIDGEKHFYRRQEVIDLINLLRVIENPSDTCALLGVLRSPLGALTDQEIYELRECGALDYRRGDLLDNWASRESGGGQAFVCSTERFGSAGIDPVHSGNH